MTDNKVFILAHSGVGRTSSSISDLAESDTLTFEILIKQSMKETPSQAYERITVEP